MPSAEFTEYAIKYSREARESRKSIPVDHLPLLGEIEAALAENPDQYPDRVIPASRDGKSFVYMHPSPRIQITYEIDKQNKVIFFFHFAEPLLQVPKTIFISYSHKDAEWLTKIRMFLSVLEQEGVIKFWDDEQLKPGQLWEEEIKQVLDSAAAGVLLVSQDFLMSKFIKEKELPKLLEGAQKEGKKIFWAPLSPSTVFESHEHITKYQSLLPDPRTSLEERSEADQKKALVEMSKLLRQVVGQGRVLS
jgi:hypothetical protein